MSMILNVPGTLLPASSELPISNSIDLKGGYKILQNDSILNTINFRGADDCKLEIGMLVYIISNQKTYRLTTIPEISTDPITLNDNFDIFYEGDNGLLSLFTTSTYYLVTTIDNVNDLVKKLNYENGDPTSWIPAWSLDYPTTWKTDEYIWSLIKYTRNSKSFFYGNPTCILNATALNNSITTQSAPTYFFAYAYQNNSPILSNITKKDVLPPISSDTTWSMTLDNAALDTSIWMITSKGYTSDNINITSFIEEWSGPLKINGPSGKVGDDGTEIEFIYAKGYQENDVTILNKILSDNKTSSSKQNDDFLVGTKYTLTNPKTGSLVEFTITDNPSGVDQNIKYEWVAIRKKDKEWGDFCNFSLWSIYGIDGKDGVGFEYIFQLTQSKDISPTDPNITSSDFQKDDYVPTGWTDNPGTVNSNYKVCWVSTRKYYKSETDTTAIWHAFTTPAIWNTYIETTPGTDGGEYRSIFTAILETDNNSLTINNTDLQKLTIGNTLTSDINILLNTYNLKYYDTVPELLDASVKAGYAIYETRNFYKENKSTETWWNLFRITGPQGIQGADGTSTQYSYALTTVYSETDYTWDPAIPTTVAGSNIPANSTYADKTITWTDHPSGIDNVNKYEWMTYRVKNSDGSWSAWSAPTVWSYYGKDGRDADSTEYIFMLSNKSTPPIDPSINNHDSLNIKDYISNIVNYNEISELYLGDGNVIQKGNWEYNSETKLQDFYYLDGTIAHQDQLTGVHYSNLDASILLDCVYFTDKQNNVTVRHHWTDDPTGVSDEWPYEYMSFRKCSYDANNNKVFEWFSKPVLWAKYGLDGKDGIDGSDGVETEYIYGLGYQESDVTVLNKILTDTLNSSLKEQDDFLVGTKYTLTNPNTSSTVEFTITDNPSGITSDIPYEFVAIRKKKNSTWLNFNNFTIWSKFGVNGKDGAGVEYIYKLTNSVNTSPGDPNSGLDITSSNFQKDDFIPDTWFDNPKTVDSTNLVCWVAVRKYYKDTNATVATWHAFSTPVVWTTFAKEGEDGGEFKSIFTKIVSTDTNILNINNNFITNLNTGDTIQAVIIDLSTNNFTYYTYAPELTDTEINAGYAVYESRCYFKNNVTAEKWSTLFRITGPRGIQGADGTSTQYSYALTKIFDVTYIWSPTNPATVSGSNIPANGTYNGVSVTWTDHPSGIDATNRHEWMTYRVKNSDGSWSAWSAPVLWSSFGKDGRDADGTEYIYLLTNTENIPSDPCIGNHDSLVLKSYISQVQTMPEISELYLDGDNTIKRGNWKFNKTTKLQDFYYTDTNYVSANNLTGLSYGNDISIFLNCEFVSENEITIRKHWTDDPTGVSEEWPYEYMSFRKCTYDSNNNPTYSWFTTPVLWAKYGTNGKDGNNGKDGTEIEYIYGLGYQESDVTVLNKVLSDNNSSTNIQKDDFLVGTKYTLTNPSTSATVEFTITDHPSGVSKDTQFEWTAIRKKTNSVWGAFNNFTIWSKFGVNGKDGDGVEYIYKMFTDKDDLTIYNQAKTPNAVPKDLQSTYLDVSSFIKSEVFQADNYCPSDKDNLWSDDPSSNVTASLKVCGYSMRKYYKDTNATVATWHAFSTPKIWCMYAEDGINGTEILSLYSKILPVDVSTNQNDLSLLNTGLKIDTYISVLQSNYSLTYTSTVPELTDTEINAGYAIYETRCTFRNSVSIEKWGTLLRLTGLKGEAGEDSSIAQYAYYLSKKYDSTLTWDPTIPSTVSNSSTPGDSSYGGETKSWTDHPSGIDATNRYEWMTYRFKKEDKTWGVWSAPKVWSAFGKDGRDADSTEYIYMLSNVATVPADPSINNHGSVNIKDHISNIVNYSEISELYLNSANNIVKGNWELNTTTGLQDFYYSSTVVAKQSNMTTSTYNSGASDASILLDCEVFTSNGTVYRHHWTDDPTGVSETWPYEYMAFRKCSYDANNNKVFEWFSTPVLWAKYGDKGNKGDKGDQGDPGDVYKFAMSKQKAVISLEDGDLYGDIELAAYKTIHGTSVVINNTSCTIDYKFYNKNSVDITAAAVTNNKDTSVTSSGFTNNVYQLIFRQGAYQTGKTGYQQLDEDSKITQIGIFMYKEPNKTDTSLLVEHLYINIAGEAGHYKSETDTKFTSVYQDISTNRSSITQTADAFHLLVDSSLKNAGIDITTGAVSINASDVINLNTKIVEVANTIESSVLKTTKKTGGGYVKIYNSYIDVFGGQEVNASDGSLYPNIRIGSNGTNSIIKFYDNSGTFLYDLGPSGLSFDTTQEITNSLLLWRLGNKTGSGQLYPSVTNVQDPSNYDVDTTQYIPRSMFNTTTNNIIKLSDKTITGIETWISSSKTESNSPSRISSQNPSKSTLRTLLLNNGIYINKNFLDFKTTFSNNPTLTSLFTSYSTYNLLDGKYFIWGTSMKVASTGSAYLKLVYIFDKGILIGTQDIANVTTDSGITYTFS